MWSRSQERFRIPVNLNLDDLSSTAGPYVTKLGMMMHCCGPECHAKRLVCYLYGQGHSRAHIIEYDLLIFLQPKLIGWYIIMSRSVLCKNWIIVFKVKVTVKVQNFIESIYILYLVYH